MMINPARLDLAADRWVAFIRSLPVVNVDLTGAVFKLQVRAVPDASGSPLIDLLSVATAAAEGVRLIEAITDTVANHLSAGRLTEVPKSYATTDTIIVSLLGIRINEATIEALPFPAERGDDLDLAWDIHITPTGGTKDRYVGGKFIIRAGATQ